MSNSNELKLTDWKVVATQENDYSQVHVLLNPDYDDCYMMIFSKWTSESTMESLIYIKRVGQDDVVQLRSVDDLVVRKDVPDFLEPIVDQVENNFDLLRSNVIEVIKFAASDEFDGETDELSDQSWILTSFIFDDEDYNKSIFYYTDDYYDGILPNFFVIEVDNSTTYRFYLFDGNHNQVKRVNIKCDDTIGIELNDNISDHMRSQITRTASSVKKAIELYDDGDIVIEYDDDSMIVEREGDTLVVRAAGLDSSDEMEEVYSDDY